MSIHYALVSLVVVCACSLPDRVGFSLGASQYDYMGAGADFPTGDPLDDKTGNEFGAQIWCEYDIGEPPIQRTVLYKPQEAVDYNIFNTPDPEPQGDNKLTTTKELTETIDATSSDTKWLFGILGVALLAAIVILAWKGKIKIPFIGKRNGKI